MSLGKSQLVRLSLLLCKMGITLALFLPLKVVLMTEFSENRKSLEILNIKGFIYR